MNAEVVHRLWVTVSVLAAVCSLGFVAAAARRERKARGRVAALLVVAPGRRRRRRRWPGAAAWIRAWGPALCVVIVGWALVGGVAGWAVGLAGAYGIRRWLRTAGPDGRAAREAAERQLPLAADLLAACLTAGAGPGAAAEAVGESLGGPVGDRLARTAAELRLGGEPADAWGRLAEIPGAADLARCLERSWSTGAPAAEPVARLAGTLRAERDRRATAGAQRAQVLITGPVGLCFLPAFLALGVAPVVIGLAGGLLNGA